MATPTLNGEKRSGLGSQVLDKLGQVAEAAPVYIGRAVDTGLRFVLGGSRNERVLRELQPTVDQISSLEPAMKRLSDARLRAKTAEFRHRLAQGETLDDLLPEAFAAVREASVRTLGLRHFDVQLLGGIVLHQGKIAEMVTGEGKTLVATAPAYLNALAHQTVHVITVNDYLAQRDQEWMQPIYEMLGMRVGLILSSMDPEQRQPAYRCDIAYGTNNEFGFDYLRDNMRPSVDRQSQRSLDYAILDEVDSILIDEARTPLIISGAAGEEQDKYSQAKKVAAGLKPGDHYEVREKEHSVVLNAEGIAEAAKRLNVETFYSGSGTDWPHLIDNALKAKEIYRRDRDYVVEPMRRNPDGTMTGGVVIIDEFTGRRMPGRRWSDGLHQAVEAKENQQIRQESQTLATITFQNLFRLYKKIAGMTGTAMGEAAEFGKVYELDVVSIPTNQTLRRRTHPDVIYRTAEEKNEAIVDEIVRMHNDGRPVLVGTISVEKSEELSRMLRKQGIEHEVLNATRHREEAKIIERAGQAGSVTIATNMAGRGTDIVLGPGVVRCKKCCIYCNDDCRKCFKLARFEDCRSERHDVPCGLHIVGTERHEARRIDNQLRGRSGRQGDPGSSRFFLSLEDDLMRIFAGEKVSMILEKIGMTRGQEIESTMVTRAIARTQRKVESHHFDVRKHLLEDDEIMNEQRKITYQQRQDILEGLAENTIESFVHDKVLARFLDPQWRKLSLRDENYQCIARWARSLNLRFGRSEWQEMSKEQFAKHLLEASRRDRPSEKELLSYVQLSTQDYLSADVCAGEWDLAGLADWAQGFGLFAAGQRAEDAVSRWQELIRTRMLEGVVAALKDELGQADPAELLSEWVSRGVYIDPRAFSATETWGYSDCSQWAERFGVEISVAEWDALGESKDGLGELLLAKFRVVAAEQADLVEFLGTGAVGAYLESPSFRERPGYERLAFWCEHRFGVFPDPAGLDQTTRAAVDEIRGELAQLKAQDNQSRPSPQVVEEWIVHSLDSFLATDLSVKGRDLNGLQNYWERKFLHAPPAFELSKRDYDELAGNLLEAVTTTCQRGANWGDLEEIVLSMCEGTVDSLIGQYLEAKPEHSPFDRSYVPLERWAAYFHIPLSSRKWLAVSRDELREHCIQAVVESEAETPSGEIIAKSVSSSADIFLDSDLLSASAGYRGLTNWACGRFALMEVQTKLEPELRRRISVYKKKLKDSLAQAKMADFDSRTEEPGRILEQCLGHALDAYLSLTPASAELDLHGLSRWTNRHFGVSFSPAKFQEMPEEEEESALREHLVQTAGRSHSKQPTEELVGATVEAALELFLPGDGLPKSWDFTRLDQWAKSFRLSGLTRPEDVCAQARQVIVDYLVEATVACWGEKNKARAIRRCVGGAFDTFLDVDLSVAPLEDNLAPEDRKDQIRRDKIWRSTLGAELFGHAADRSMKGRNFAALVTKFERKFKLVCPFELSKKSNEEVRAALVKAAIEAYREWRQGLAHTEKDQLRTERRRQGGSAAESDKRAEQEGTADRADKGFEAAIEDAIRDTERSCLLRVVDMKWKDHLYAMDHLKGGIGLSAYGGVDPRVAFKQEGYKMFSSMISAIEDSVTDVITKMDLVRGETWKGYQGERFIHQESDQFAFQQQQALAGNMSGEGAVAQLVAEKAPNRNAPCPCGSKKANGRPKKYKECCLLKE